MALELLSLHEQGWDEAIGVYNGEPYSENAYLQAMSSLEGGLPVVAKGSGDGWEATYVFLLFAVGNQWTMVRTSEYGGPIIRCNGRFSDPERATLEFRAQLDEHFLAEGVIEEVTMLSPWLPHGDVIARTWGCESEKRICLVSLAELEQKWKTLSKGRRSDINRARRESMIEIQPYCEADVGRFSAHYDEAMDRLDARDRWRFDKSYFSCIADRLEDRLVLVTAEGSDGGAGALFLRSEHHAAYFLAARWGDQIGTPSLVLWEGLQHLREQGVEEVLLGGGATSREDDSLLNFKSSFATTQSWLALGGRIYRPEQVDIAVAGGFLRTPPKSTRVVI